MSEPIIRVEGLGKRYRLRHQAGGGGYRALRDVLTDGVRGAVGRLRGRRSATVTTEEFWALQDVSFDVAPGEVVGVIGRNGAGKSTLLKVLSRITEPTTGRVTLDGRVASLLEVGTGFHPELSGRENIYLNGSILGMTRREIARKFDEIVAFAEVERFLDTPVKRYSSGMYVRLAFAVAAHLEPEILIVDEVLAVGDAEFQKKCLGKMGEVAQGGRTVLFVSHNMAAVQALCSHGVLLAAGRVVMDGPVAEVLHRYTTDRPAERRSARVVPLGDGLRLDRLWSTPVEPVSGGPVELVVELSADAPVAVPHLCLIVYSGMEVRTAIFDLRPRDGTVRVVAGRLTVTCRVDELNLVEGEYTVGLYVRTATDTLNLLDVARLVVAPAPPTDQFVPYPAEHRGVADLRYVVTAAPATSDRPHA